MYRYPEARWTPPSVQAPSPPPGRRVRRRTTTGAPVSARTDRGAGTPTAFSPYYIPGCAFTTTGWSGSLPRGAHRLPSRSLRTVSRSRALDHGHHGGCVGKRMRRGSERCPSDPCQNSPASSVAATASRESLWTGRGYPARSLKWVFNSILLNCRFRIQNNNLKSCVSSEAEHQFTTGFNRPIYNRPTMRARILLRSI